MSPNLFQKSSFFVQKAKTTIYFQNGGFHYISNDLHFLRCT